METQQIKLKSLVQSIQESITLKLGTIGFLVLVLLIPATWINSLIEERQGRSERVVQEISEKWSGSQTLSGPILVIPFTKQEKIYKGKNEFEIHESEQKAFFLPEKFDVKGNINPQKLHRGIFEAVVYTSELDIHAEFSKPDFKSMGIPEELVLWEKSYMIFALTDLGGISQNPDFKSGGEPLKTEPSNSIGISINNYIKEAPAGFEEASHTMPSKALREFASNGIIARLNWKSSDDFETITSVKLNLKGSRRLSFTPTGKSTSVNLKGPWSSPSFDGEFLPESRKVTEEGFTSTWNVLHFNRPFSQEWTGNENRVFDSDFGIRLLVPVEQYQKSMRTSKYGHLIIILTFVALFLVEITKKIRIHPFQYILIGAALVIYYTLLLSISEQLGFTPAYWIATVATVILISFYASTFLKNGHMVILLSLLMMVFYSFIFVIILQQDYSLLIGSIGLFLVIGAVMYFSRKVTWYKEASNQV